MKQLLLALHMHHDDKGRFPQAATYDAEGKPLNSWRTAILPFVEQNVLYDKLKFNEPWNSKANWPVVYRDVDLYECPSCNSPTIGFNNYYAIVDEKTAWRKDYAISFHIFADGTSKTVMLIEGPPSPWAEPKDLSFAEALELLTTPVVPKINGGHNVDHGWFYKPSTVRNIGFADGHVEQLRCNLPVDVATALLTANGKEKLSPEDWQSNRGPELDYAKCTRLAFFILLALLPAVREWRKKKLAVAESIEP